MTDSERTALVEEIQAIIQGCVIVANMDDDAPPTTISEGTLNNMAYSLLPIIDRLIAERDMDAARPATRYHQDCPAAPGRARKAEAACETPAHGY